MELHPALRSCGFGDVPWNPYQHLRLCGAERHTGFWRQRILEHLQHSDSASGSGGLHRAAATAEHARFAAKEQAVLRKEGQADSICTITDISLGGAKIAGSPPAWARNGEEGVLLLDGGALRVPFRFIGLDRWQDFGRGFPIVFEAGIPLRHALTARLFVGAYRGAIDDIDVPRVISPLGKRLVR
jgi:hypothetical protein